MGLGEMSMDARNQHASSAQEERLEVGPYAKMRDCSKECFGHGLFLDWVFLDDNGQRGRGGWRMRIIGLQVYSRRQP